MRFEARVPRKHCPTLRDCFPHPVTPDELAALKLGLPTIPASIPRQFPYVFHRRSNILKYRVSHLNLFHLAFNSPPTAPVAPSFAPPANPTSQPLSSRPSSKQTLVHISPWRARAKAARYATSRTIFCSRLRLKLLIAVGSPVPARDQPIVIFVPNTDSAHAVGGIYSVIKSKAPVTTAEYGDRYTLIGPLNAQSVSAPLIPTDLGASADCVNCRPQWRWRRLSPPTLSSPRLSRR